ncbi:MAG: hypothetical protein V1854_06875 [Methanobacteriota archaeon]
MIIPCLCSDNDWTTILRLYLPYKEISARRFWYVKSIEDGGGFL